MAHPSHDIDNHGRAFPEIGNHLLAALPTDEWEQLRPRLDRVDLPINLHLFGPGEQISHAWFPRCGIVSSVIDTEEGTVEVGTVGREGMAGLALVLQSDTMSQRTFIQVKGEGYRMPAAEFRAALDELPSLRPLMLSYAQCLFEQIAQSAACNRMHTLEERCARWLLMTHDRADGDELGLKQKFLAEMLGVHRPAVTLAAGALQKAGLIDYSRGKVRILDRKRLEEASCSCYRAVRECFAQLRERVPRRHET